EDRAGLGLLLYARKPARGPPRRKALLCMESGVVAALLSQRRRTMTPPPTREGDRMASDNVVLVHGGFVDGSGWEGVYGILKRDGYKVSVVQNPTLSLEGDVAATKLII